MSLVKTMDLPRREKDSVAHIVVGPKMEGGRKRKGKKPAAPPLLAQSILPAPAARTSTGKAHDGDTDTSLFTWNTTYGADKKHFNFADMQWCMQHFTHRR